MKKIITSSLLVVAAIGLLFTSCKKNDITLDENDKAIAQESAIAQQKMGDIASIADEASSKEGFTRLRAASSCVTKSYSPYSGHPKGAICTLTFAGSCLDSIERKGQIIIACDDTSKGISSARSITFNGYQAGGTSVGGTITFTGATPYSNGVKYTLAINATLTEGAQSSKFGGSLDITIDNGASATLSKDDIYYFDGSATGTTYSGTTYSVSITKQLKKFNDYRCIVSGSVTFTNSSSSTSTKTIDFGNGAKDNKATLTVGSVTDAITL